MSITAIVWSCAHVTPKADNKRFEWLGNLIFDIKPDYTVDLGDFADLASLNSYDTRYPKAIVSQSYQADIEATIEAQELIWDKFAKRKTRKPYRIGIQGNHEYRIDRAVSIDPRIEGKKYGVSFEHLQTRRFYDEYHRYKNSAPAIVERDGVYYSHFISSGNFGAALSGIHHGYALTQKVAASCTVGHSHIRHYYCKQDAKPTPIHGLVVGNFKGKQDTWAGQAQNNWWSGVCIKRHIKNGNYDLQFISMEALEKDYG